MPKVCKIRDAVATHVIAMAAPELVPLLTELERQQQVLDELVGPVDLDPDAGADELVAQLRLRFPFSVLLRVLSDSKAVQGVFTEASQWEASSHAQAVGQVVRLLRSRKNLRVEGEFLSFYLAEYIVCFFVRAKLLSAKSDPMHNFATLQKADAMAADAARRCQLRTSIVERLRAAPETFTLEAEDTLGLRKPVAPAVEAEIEIPALMWTILEFRRTQFEVSPSSMLAALAGASRALSVALRGNGELLGADEIFQFTVYALAVARVTVLPAISEVLDTFMLDAYRETRFGYMVQQLGSALEFIELQPLPTGDLVLLPFREIPETMSKCLELATPEPVTVRDFAVMAFPIWSQDAADLFPACCAFTGRASDKSTLFKFRADAPELEHRLEKGFTLVPSSVGTFLVVDPLEAEERWMIRVASGDLTTATSTREVDAMSAILLMNEKVFKRPSTEDALFRDLAPGLTRRWNLQGFDLLQGLEVCLAELQVYLVELGLLRKSPDGRLNRDTVLALRRAFPGGPRSGFVFAPEIPELLRGEISRRAKGEL
jgi:hypothetical protein